MPDLAALSQHRHEDFERNGVRTGLMFGGCLVDMSRKISSSGLRVARMDVLYQACQLGRTMSVFGLSSALIACKILAEVLPGLSSHSAMATVLSWLAKAGLKL